MDPKTLLRKARLKALIDDRYGTQLALSQRSGLSEGRISQMLDPALAFGERAARSLAKRLGIDEYYFERDESAQSNVELMPTGGTPIPLISSIQAGAWSEIANTFQRGDAEEWLLTDQRVSGEAFALRIKGKSMYRANSAESYDEGDVVIIDPAIFPNAGDCVAAKNGDQEATFKKYRPRGLNNKGVEYFELVPLNEDFEKMRSDLEPIQIIGTMVEHRRYRRP